MAEKKHPKVVKPTAEDVEEGSDNFDLNAVPTQTEPEQPIEDIDMEQVHDAIDTMIGHMHDLGPTRMAAAIQDRIREDPVSLEPFKEMISTLFGNLRQLQTLAP